MYILFRENNVVKEIIPDIDPAFPEIPIHQRYASDFISSLLHFPDNTEVEQNWIYDSKTKTFSAPEEI
jgi:hypothetical protein